jgi:hypothetical protein
LYDDLHKNIRDQNKYSNANLELVQDIIKLKPELKQPYSDKIAPLLKITNTKESI